MSCVSHVTVTVLHLIIWLEVSGWVCLFWLIMIIYTQMGQAMCYSSRTCSCTIFEDSSNENTIERAQLHAMVMCLADECRQHKQALLRGGSTQKISACTNATDSAHKYCW